LIIGDCGSGWPVHHGGRVTKFVHYRRRSITDIVISPQPTERISVPTQKGGGRIAIDLHRAWVLDATWSPTFI